MEHDQESQQGRRRFRIWVAGRLGESFAGGFDGVEQEDGAEGTTLSGEMIDQSHVHGILDRLRRLGVEVLRFEIYRPDGRGPPPPGVESPEPGEVLRVEDETGEES